MESISSLSVLLITGGKGFRDGQSYELTLVFVKRARRMNPSGYLGDSADFC